MIAGDQLDIDRDCVVSESMLVNKRAKKKQKNSRRNDVQNEMHQFRLAGVICVWLA